MSQALAGSRTKPSLGVQVDYSHPFASGLVGCYLFNEGGGRVAHDLSPYANHGLATAAPIWIKRTADSGVYLDTNYYFDCGSRDSQGLGRGLTILAACTIDNLANYRNLIWRQAPAGTGYGMICWADGGLRLQDATTDVTASTLAIDTNYILGYTNAASNGSGGASNSKIGYTWSRSGGLSVVAGSGSLNAAGSGTYYTSIGKDHTNNRPWRGNLYWLYMWNRPLAKSDIVRLISEPYCFFQSQPAAVRRYVATATFKPAWALKTQRVIGGGVI